MSGSSDRENELNDTTAVTYVAKVPRFEQIGWAAIGHAIMRPILALADPSIRVFLSHTSKDNCELCRRLSRDGVSCFFGSRRSH